jgi:hypothetical protein
MAAPTSAARVKKTLANPEPSTHGPKLPRFDLTEMGPLSEEHRSRIRAPAGRSARPSLMWWTAPAPGIEVP